MLDLQSALAGLLGNARPVVNQQSPRNSALAKALMSQSMQGNIQTPMELMGKLGQFWAGNKVENDRLAQEKQKNDDLVKALAGAGDDGGAIASTLIQSGDPDLMKMGIQLRTAKAQPKDSWGDTFQLPDGSYAQRNSVTGKIEPVTKAAAGGQTGMFGGNSVEAQGLNWLVGKGHLTEEQAANVAAGKTVTAPDGSIIFMTPQGIFAQPANGGPAVPVAPSAGQPTAAQPAASAPAAAASPAPMSTPSPQPAAAPEQRPGMIPITGPKPGGGATEQQANAATYADRMITSGKLIDDLEKSGTSMTDTALSRVPVLGNAMISEDYQKFDQAKRDFINAQLRRESGAVISDQEFDNANKQYFPQPGDTPATIAQKRENRRVAIEGMRRASGPTYKPPGTGTSENDPLGIR